MELKWPMLNKHKRWFHSSRVKFPFVSLSASWFLVSMNLIWILGSKLVLSNNQSRATLWVLETCLTAELLPFHNHFNYSFIVFKDAQQSFLVRRVRVWGNKSTLFRSSIFAGIFFRVWDVDMTPCGRGRLRPISTPKGGARRVGGPKFRVFFSPPAPIFILSSVSRGSSRGNLVGMSLEVILKMSGFTPYWILADFGLPCWLVTLLTFQNVINPKHPQKHPHLKNTLKNTSKAPLKTPQTPKTRTIIVPFCPPFRWSLFRLPKKSIDHSYWLCGRSKARGGPKMAKIQFGAKPDILTSLDNREFRSHVAQDLQSKLHVSCEEGFGFSVISWPPSPPSPSLHPTPSFGLRPRTWGVCVSVCVSFCVSLCVPLCVSLRNWPKSKLAEVDGAQVAHPSHSDMKCFST